MTTAAILDGKTTADLIRAELAVRAATLTATTGAVACLAAVLVGEDPASTAYVNTKSRACKRANMASQVFRMSADSSQGAVEGLVDRLNADPLVHGILVQHPVPAALNETAILARIRYEKDVDGISRSSLGALLTGERAFVSCTPLGMMELLARYNIPVAGRRAVVVGRSVILGKPMAMLLLNAHATVTICHSRTVDLPSIVREAEILVAAVGRPEFIRGEWLQRGAVVLDAGYNVVPGRTETVGDVHFDSAAEVAGHITPVPGGVGPMTIAMLLRNTLEAAEASQS